jgi:WD40 repeat protein/transcriptional regulator with XRE-family HTH domain
MSYHRRYKLKDNTFGLLALTMRERAGLVQVEVASVLGVSERAIRHWECGTSYPTAANLKELIKLYMQHGSFAPGQEHDEVKAFWEQASESAARRKSLFDEAWFAELYKQQFQAQIQAQEPEPQQYRPASEVASVPALSRRVDWGEALDVTSFYGRERELLTLTQWVQDERCRMVIVLGMGGIGKTTLSTRVAQEAAPHFDFVFWRSLRNAPLLDELLTDCIHALSEQRDLPLSSDLAKKSALLLELLRKRRCLLVLDNVETLLQAGQLEGSYRAGYEGYGQFIQRVAETAHQSCLLLTSREMLDELEALEGTQAAVRALKLAGLGQAASQQLLADKDLFGQPQDWDYFVQHYSGNPLALKIVAATVRDIFGGDIAAFERESPLTLHTLRQLLEHQFARLTPLEQDVMYWLAIERELVSLETLSADLLDTVPRREILLAIKSLRRRCLVERGERGAVFTLQPEVMEYAGERLVDWMCEEIVHTSPRLLLSHALLKARGNDYIRDSQSRMLVQPVLANLQTHFGSTQEVEQQLHLLLHLLRRKPISTHGYGGGNLLNLLVSQRGDLRAVDCSALAIRQAYLQGIEAQGANFAGAQISETLFTEPIESIASMALSHDGKYLAVGSFSGQIRVWNVAAGTLLLNVQAHHRAAWSLAFGPESWLLASGGYDGLVKLWQIEEEGRELSGRCIRTIQAHHRWVRSIAFSMDGALLATGGEDEAVRVWQVDDGACLQVLCGHRGMVWSVAFSPDGTRLITGGDDRLARVWDTSTGACLHALSGHNGTILSVAFHPAGQCFASGGEDGQIRLWNVDGGQCVNTLRLRTSRAASVAFNPEGTMLAGGCFDGTIETWLLAGQSGPQRIRTLAVHTTWVSVVAFGPGGLLASASYNGKVHLWNVENGKCLSTFQGYSSVISALAFSPDTRLLVHGDNNGILKVWDIATAAEGTCRSVFQGHAGRIWSVAFSPDGRTIASGGDDLAIKLWDVETGRLLKILHGHATMVWSVAFSPDGKLLAGSGFDHTVRIWDLEREGGTEQPAILGGHATFVWSVAFSPDGSRLASGDNDGEIKVWEVQNGACLTSMSSGNSPVGALAFGPDGAELLSSSSNEMVTLWDVAKEGHRHYRVVESQVQANWARAMAFNRDGTMLATGGDRHTIRLWQVADQGHAVSLKTFAHGSGQVWSVAFSSDSRLLASGDDDGTLIVWDITTAARRHILRSDRPYERLNIRGLSGITEAQRAALRALGAVENA